MFPTFFIVADCQEILPFFKSECVYNCIMQNIQLLKLLGFIHGKKK